MHVETLKIFCDLAELRSFSKTAEKHLLSQSAISQQIAQLELNFKCQLLVRKKPLELTAAGQLFYKAAGEMFERYEQFQSELNAQKSSASSRINVAAIFSIGMYSLPDYVKRFMIEHPNINVHIEYLSASRIYELVLAGEVDVGLVAVPRRDKRLEVYEFENERLVLACSPKHPLAGQSQIDIDKIQFERFIGFEEAVPTRVWIDSLLQRCNVSVQLAMEFDNTETIKRAVEINSGVSILPRAVIEQELRNGILNAVEIADEIFVRPTGIIVRKDKILSPASRHLIELLSQKDEI